VTTLYKAVTIDYARRAVRDGFQGVTILSWGREI
jgi:hypothetical protein